MLAQGEKEVTEELTDQSLVDYLRRHRGSTITDLVAFSGVTATAVRQRLNRLMGQGLVEREVERAGRGRPMHRYSLSEAGERSSGDNYAELVTALWSEMRAIADPDVRSGLVRRVAGRLADVYRDRIDGADLRERMESVVGLMKERDVPFEVRQDKSELPVLTALACPYPDLAEQDRGICSLEKVLLSDLLGKRVRLSGCRLDGENCCTFEASSVASATA